MDPLNLARYGMMTAESRLDASAQRVAAFGPDLDLSNEAVEMIEARQQFAASAKVASFADDMWRTLISIQSR